VSYVAVVLPVIQSCGRSIVLRRAGDASWQGIVRCRKILWSFTNRTFEECGISMAVSYKKERGKIRV